MTNFNSNSQSILPINIIPLMAEAAGRSPKDTIARYTRRLREFLRQKGLAENTERSYRQLKKFSSWCNKSWLDVTPSDIGSIGGVEARTQACFY